MSNINIKDIDNSRLLECIKQDSFLILDVRTEKEYLENHLNQALLLPLSDLTDKITSLPKDKKILVHCSAGKRSQEGVDYLKSQGYDAINIGGLDFLSDEIKEILNRIDHE